MNNKHLLKIEPRGERELVMTRTFDAPRALVEPLFGLPDGDGDWLRHRLLAHPGTPTYN